MAKIKSANERLAISVGTKLRPHQYATVVECASALGIDTAEYVRRCLTSAANQQTTFEQMYALLLPLFAEIVAVRSIMVNTNAFEGSGQPLNDDLLRVICARADATKYERARALVSTPISAIDAHSAGSSDTEAA